MPYQPASSGLERTLGARLVNGESLHIEIAYEPRHGRKGLSIEPGSEPCHELGTLADAAAEELTRIERLEAAKACLEAELLQAYARLHATEEAICGEPSRAAYRSTVPVTAEQVVVHEIAAATGVGAFEVARRLELAVSARRQRRLLDALGDGRVSLHRALQITACTRVLDDAEIDAVVDSVLAPSADGGVSSQRLFTRRLSRAVASASPGAAVRRRKAAREGRTAHGRLAEDGMGSFTVTTTAERVVAVLDRADQAARAARAAGDGRTLDQLRSDFVCDAVLYGWPAAAPRPASDAGSADDAGSAEVLRASAGLGASAETTSAAVGSGGPQADPGAADHGAARPLMEAIPAPDWIGQPPPARVWIVVPFEVAVGASDAACELPGHGWVTAEHAREIMTAPGSVWQRLAVDVHTGRALELATDAYTPTAAMVAHVRAVDGVCRGPACDVPAHRCDIDHELPWPAGRTVVDNLYAKHRLCHMAKTARIWESRPVADGGLEWTTLARRTYVTYPRDWREGVGPVPAELRPGADPHTEADEVACATVQEGAGMIRTTSLGGAWDGAPPF